MNWRKIAIVVVFVTVGLAFALQVASSIREIDRAERLQEQLTEIEVSDLGNEKLRQEIAAIREENESRSEIWSNLVTDFGPLMALFGAIVAAFIPLRTYLDNRSRERLDKAAAELRSILDRLAAEESPAQLMGVVALEHYFTPDKREYHEQALSALLSLSRMLRAIDQSGTLAPEDDELQRAVTRAVERAVSQMDLESLQHISWQGVRLPGVSFARLSQPRALPGADFRDADLEGANLADVDLEGSSFRAAILKGARLERSRLVGCDLTYADFAGAVFSDADLTEAMVDGVKLLNAVFDGAVLHSLRGLEAPSLPWHLARDWRKACFDDQLRSVLAKRYGAGPTGPRVLMLMWEVSPVVAGGTWTASYHLVRKLRRQGADITVVVPWSEEDLQSETHPFGSEVRVVPLGIPLPSPTGDPGGLPYGSPSWSSYGSSFSQPSWNPYASSTPYGGGSSAYGSTASGWSPYAMSWGSTAGPSGSPYDRLAGRGIAIGSRLLRLREEFQQRLLHFAALESFDVIHAHDWITFGAAEALSRATDKPWVGHVHSTEMERRPYGADPVIWRLESQGVLAADRLIVPSHVTADVLHDQYGVGRGRTVVMPNPLSEQDVPISQTGRFNARRVVFTGRLTPQKGVDRFGDLADMVRSENLDIEFRAYGEGEAWQDLIGRVGLSGSLPWERRGEAFADASVVVVPSRAEPFGMVVLEAMLHRVPVLYPEGAGVAEVIGAGLPIDPHDGEAMARLLRKLLHDWEYWEQVVAEQARAIETYLRRDDELLLIDLWSDLIRGLELSPVRSG